MRLTLSQVVEQWFEVIDDDRSGALEAQELAQALSVGGGKQQTSSKSAIHLQVPCFAWSSCVLGLGLVVPPFHPGGSPGLLSTRALHCPCLVGRGPAFSTGYALYCPKPSRCDPKSKDRLLRVGLATPNHLCSCPAPHAAPLLPRAAPQAAGVACSEGDVRELVALIDINGDGSVTWAEFQTFLLKVRVAWENRSTGVKG